MFNESNEATLSFFNAGALDRIRVDLLGKWPEGLPFVYLPSLSPEIFDWLREMPEQVYEHARGMVQKNIAHEILTNVRKLTLDAIGMLYDEIKNTPDGTDLIIRRAFQALNNQFPGQTDWLARRTPDLIKRFSVDPKTKLPSNAAVLFDHLYHNDMEDNSTDYKGGEMVGASVDLRTVTSGQAGDGNFLFNTFRSPEELTADHTRWFEHVRNAASGVHSEHRKFVGEICDPIAYVNALGLEPHPEDAIPDDIRDFSFLGNIGRAVSDGTNKNPFISKVINVAASAGRASSRMANFMAVFEPKTGINFLSSSLETFSSPRTLARLSSLLIRDVARKFRRSPVIGTPFETPWAFRVNDNTFNTKLMSALEERTFRRKSLLHDFWIMEYVYDDDFSWLGTDLLNDRSHGAAVHLVNTIAVREKCSTVDFAIAAAFKAVLAALYMLLYGSFPFCERSYIEALSTPLHKETRDSRFNLITVGRLIPILIPIMTHGMYKQTFRALRINLPPRMYMHNRITREIDEIDRDAKSLSDNELWFLESEMPSDFLAQIKRVNDRLNDGMCFDAVMLRPQNTHSMKTVVMLCKKFGLSSIIIGYRLFGIITRLVCNGPHVGGAVTGWINENYHSFISGKEPVFFGAPGFPAFTSYWWVDQEWYAEFKKQNAIGIRSSLAHMIFEEMPPSPEYFQFELEDMLIDPAHDLERLNAVTGIPRIHDFTGTQSSTFLIDQNDIGAALRRSVDRMEDVFARCIDYLTTIIATWVTAENLAECSFENAIRMWNEFESTNGSNPRFRWKNLDGRITFDDDALNNLPETAKKLFVKKSIRRFEIAFEELLRSKNSFIQFLSVFWVLPALTPEAPLHRTPVFGISDIGSAMNFLCPRPIVRYVNGLGSISMRTNVPVRGNHGNIWLYDGGREVPDIVSYPPRGLAAVEVMIEALIDNPHLSEWKSDEKTTVGDHITYVSESSDHMCKILKEGLDFMATFGGFRPDMGLDEIMHDRMLERFKEIDRFHLFAICGFFMKFMVKSNGHVV